MFNIPIKVEGLERKKRSTGLLHVVAGFFLIVNAGDYYRQLHFRSFWLVLPVYLVALISLAYGLSRKKFDPQARYNRWVRLVQVIMFAMLGLVMLPLAGKFRLLSLFLWAAVCLLLFFSERNIFQQASVSFTESGIILPGFFSGKMVPWHEVSDVRVRADYLTIYYPSNKYIQFEVLNEMNEKEIEKINDFGKQKIHENKLEEERI